MKVAACTFVTLLAASMPAFANTTFLHHFDGATGLGGGTADYAVGSPNEQIGPPLGNGGALVTGGQFGGAIDRSTGGRLEYATAGNYNVNKGTIEMWVKGAGVTNNGFFGLWGTDTSSGSGDIRMYIYDAGGSRVLGAYQNGAGGSFWEIEQAIPAANLDSTNWHHLAWAFDTAAGVTATWWDGQLLRNTPDAGTVNPRTSFSGTLMHIGENQAGSATWPGLIDEVRISDSLVYDTTQNLTVPTSAFVVPEPTTLSMISGLAVTLIRRRR